MHAHAAALGQQVELVGHKDSRGTLGDLAIDALVEDVLPNVRVHGTEGVVKQQHVRTGVDGTSQRDALHTSTSCQ